VGLEGIHPQEEMGVLVEEEQVGRIILLEELEHQDKDMQEGRAITTELVLVLEVVVVDRVQ
jgi:hypothetical protein